MDAAFAGFNDERSSHMARPGSGKSWSMTGASGDNGGLIPRINAEIFARIEASSEEKLYLVQC